MAGISFDRAAGYYDATRRLPEAVLEEVVEILLTELRGRRCLEIGVGTGRIALPLHRRGVELLGADIARGMLERLVDKAGTALPLLQADATRLPLAAASLDAVLASHVLHLIPEWRSAADEVMRVLGPGGVFLVDFGGGTAAPWSRPVQELLDRRGIRRVRPGANTAEQLAGHLGPGISARRLPAVSMTLPRTLARDLEQWEGRIFSWTWPYSPEEMAAAGAEVRAWAAGEGWPLDRPVEVRRDIQWWAFSAGP